MGLLMECNAGHLQEHPLHPLYIQFVRLQNIALSLETRQSIERNLYGQQKKQKTLREKIESWLGTKKSTMKIEETLPVII